MPIVEPVSYVVVSRHNRRDSYNCIIDFAFVCCCGDFFFFFVFFFLLFFKDPTFLGEPLTIAMAQTNLARGISRVRIAKNGIPPTMPTGSVVWKTGRCSSTCHLITMTLQSDWK